MLFFIVIIFLGSYYLVNLILAIVAMSYDELQKKAEEEEMADAAEMEAIREEEEARAQKIAARAAASEATASGTGGGGNASDAPKSPSGFSSSRSYETWTGEEQFKGRIRSECSFFRGSHSRLVTGQTGPKRTNADASVSLPGSPYNKRRGSQPYGRDKLMVLSTYMDAQEHLPYADDSTAATPMSEENGAIILPFCNGMHHHSNHHQVPSFGEM